MHHHPPVIDTVYLTEGLVDALLELAERRDPSSVSAALTVTPAGELTPEDTTADWSALSPETPVFTDLYVPTDERAVDAVFGVDVTIPHGQTQGRFLSHPNGRLGVSASDDLHEVVIIAVPPWTHDDIAAFDRAGQSIDLRTLAAVPPQPDW